MNTGNSTTTSEATVKPNSGGANAEHTATSNDAPKGPGKRKSTTEAATHSRFFLAKKDALGGSPSLGQEFTQEGEAMVEAFKTGATYYRIEEYKAVADFSNGMPALKKEPVIKK